MIEFTGPSSYKLSQLQVIKPYRWFTHFLVHRCKRAGIFTLRLVADHNTETITSKHNEVFLPFLFQSPWNADPILQFQLSNSNSPVSVLQGTYLYSPNLLNQFVLVFTIRLRETDL
jgi:hypothetical protein